jgi:hypothetical protein
MTDDRDRRRRYGDKEVGLILKRAAELHQQEPRSEVEGGGLSLADLEEVAAEAGINPIYIARAAADLDAVTTQRDGISRFTGAPLSVEFERSIAGELPEDAFEHLIPEIQRAAGSQGQLSLVGRTLTWQSSTGDNVRSLQVTVVSRTGRTRIRIEERCENLAWSLFGGAIGGVGGGVGLGVGLGVGIGALGSVLFTIAFPLAAFTGSYIVARTSFTYSVRKRQRVLRDLLDRLTEEVLAATVEPPLDTTESAGRLPGE